jgi:hypothetical protein
LNNDNDTKTKIDDDDDDDDDDGYIPHALHLNENSVVTGHMLMMIYIT